MIQMNCGIAGEVRETLIFNSENRKLHEQNEQIIANPREWADALTAL